MHAVATDDTLRNNLIKAGRPIARRFSWPSSAEEHRAVYSGLLSATHSG
jgi:hypothetical protein